MFTRLYLEALLVNKKGADDVWEAWIVDRIDDAAAKRLWTALVKQNNKNDLQGSRDDD